MEYQEFYDFVVKVHSIAKIGLTYSKDPYALENYKELNEISTKMIENFMNIKFDKPSMFTREVYPTPNVSCRTIIVEDNKILLVREENSGLWSIPGGWCDLYDSPSQAAFNEVSQEAGVDPNITKLIGVIERTPRINDKNIPEYVLFFEGKINSNSFHEHTHETTAVDFFDLDNLPPMSKKVDSEDLQRILKAYRNNEVIFD